MAGFHDKAQTAAAFLQVAQNAKTNANLEKIGKVIKEESAKRLEQDKKHFEASQDAAKRREKIARDSLDVERESLDVARDSLDDQKNQGAEQKRQGKTLGNISDGVGDVTQMMRDAKENKSLDKDVKNIAFDIKTDLDSLKGNDDPVEVFLTVGTLSETMAKNNINTHSVSDLEYKEIIVNIEKDVKSLKEQSIAKFSKQDQEDLELMYDIVAENEEEKITGLEKKIAKCEMNISENKNKVVLLEKKHEAHLNSINNLKIDRGKRNTLSIDEVIKKDPNDIVAGDPNLDIIDNINNDVLYNLGGKLIGSDHEFFESIKKKGEEKVSILWIFIGFLFFLPLFYYFYKKFKLKKINSDLKTLKFYDFSGTEKTELKKIITEKYKKIISQFDDDINKMENELPSILEQIEKGKKEHEDFEEKENEKISAFKEQITKLTAIITEEFKNAGDLLKRRPYLDSHLVGRFR